ncbi:hypothetical protein D3C75_948250 [compost metagenome]
MRNWRDARRDDFPDKGTLAISPGASVLTDHNSVDSIAQDHQTFLPLQRTVHLSILLRNNRKVAACNPYPTSHIQEGIVLYSLAAVRHLLPVHCPVLVPFHQCSGPFQQDEYKEDLQASPLLEVELTRLPLFQQSYLRCGRAHRA